MENTSTFDLNDAIRRWRDGLSQLPHFRADDLAELEAHLRDSAAELRSRGLSDEEAFLLATRRLGKPMALEPEFAKVNRSQVWVNRLLWMLIGIQVWGVLVTLSRLIADAAVLGGLAGSGSNLPRTDPMLASALFGLANLLVLAGCVVGCWQFMRRGEGLLRKVALQALQRPMLLSLGLSVLALLVAGSTNLEWVLLNMCYAPAVATPYAIAKGYAGLVLYLVQVPAFTILTIVLFRRHFHLGRAC